MTDIAATLNERDARKLTDRIRAGVTETWRLLAESYDREAWRVLGYASWRDYAVAEFGMSEAHAYRLLDQARVATTLEAAGVSPIGELNEHTARQLKPVLAEVVTELQAAIDAGADPTEAFTAAVERVKERSADRPTDETTPRSVLVTLRVPTEVLTAFDRSVIAANTNRSAAIVNFMRSVAGMPSGRGGHGANCSHPDAKRARHPWGEICGECGARVA